MNPLTVQALALLGGEPVQASRFPKHTTLIGDEERQEVLAVPEDGEPTGFSRRAGARFLGGPILTVGRRRRLARRWSCIQT